MFTFYPCGCIYAGGSPVCVIHERKIGMTYDELRRGAFFRVAKAPVLLLQKLEHCAVTMDSKIVVFLGSTEVKEEPVS